LALAVVASGGAGPGTHGPKGFTSQFKGVWWDKSRDKWGAKSKRKTLGFHATVGRCRFRVCAGCTHETHVESAWIYAL